jgi:hypothetical protein
MSIHLITGQGTTDHVKSADAGSLNAGIVGTGRYVLNRGNKFSYEVVSNNLIKIHDGDLLNQGRHINIAVNDYEECTIENGLQSVKRNDLIVLHYTKNTQTEIETAAVVVIKGVSGNTAVDPTYTTGNILNGDAVDDFPLYRVRLNGLSIEGVDQLFTVNKSLSDMDASKVNYTDMLATIADYRNTSTTGKMVDVMLEKSLQKRVYKKIGKNLIENNIVYDPTIMAINDDMSIRCFGAVHSGNLLQPIGTAYFEPGTYTVSGCPGGGSVSSFYQSVRITGSSQDVATDFGSGSTLEVTSPASYRLYLHIAKDYPMNATFHPQICYADTENPLVYEQYAPSNAELNSNLAAFSGLKIYRDHAAVGAPNSPTTINVSSYGFTQPPTVIVSPDCNGPYVVLAQGSALDKNTIQVQACYDSGVNGWSATSTAVHILAIGK